MAITRRQILAATAAAAGTGLLGVGAPTGCSPFTWPG